MAKMLGKLFSLGKTVPKTLAKGATSTTTRELKGSPFKLADWPEEKIIDHVVKGQGNKRWIVFTDGSALPTTKSFAMQQAQIIGGKRTVGEAVAGGKKTKYDAAVKALGIQMSKFETRAGLTPAWKIKQIKQDHKMYRQQSAETGDQAIDYTMVRKGKMVFPMPTEYAKILRKAGLVTFE